MTQPQAVIGFFDNLAEAQQAIQLLLASDFAPTSITLSTQTDQTLPAPGSSTLDMATNSEAAETTGVDINTGEASSGRFLFSLFGSLSETPPGTARFDVSRPAGTFVMVYIQSSAEAKRAFDVLNHADASLHQT